LKQLTTWTIFCSTRLRWTWIDWERSATGRERRLYCRLSNNSMNRSSSCGFPSTTTYTCSYRTR